MKAVRHHLIPGQMKACISAPVIFGRDELSAHLVLLNILLLAKVLLSGHFPHIRVHTDLSADPVIVLIFFSFDPLDCKKSYFPDPFVFRHLKAMFRRSPACSVQQKLTRLSLRHLHCKIHPVSTYDRSKWLRTSLHFFHIFSLSYCQPSVPYISTLSRPIKNVSS